MRVKAQDSGCIYMYRCLVSGKAYIGQTRRRLQDRAWQHERSAKSGAQTRFYHAIRKHGINNMVLGIIEDNVPKEDLNQKEMFYIEKYDTYRNGYNATAGGDSPSEFTEERRRKIGEKSKGRKLSEETKEKIGRVHKGKTMTEETKAAISKKMKQVAKDNAYEKRFKNGVGIEAPSFKPWWFEVEGYRVNVKTMTLSDYAKSQGLNVSTFIKQFGTKRKGKLVTAGMFKGMRFGYIGEVYE
jgi:group I intron endonuclease